MTMHQPSGGAERARPILIAVDGSISAGAAFDVGLELAVSRHAPVTALHIAPATSERLFRADPLHIDPPERILAADPVLARLANRAEERGVAVEFRLSGGAGDDLSNDRPGPDSVVPSILGIAAARDAQLIVLGSRGRRGLARALGGSTSEEVAREAGRPVLVVRE